MPTIKLFCVVFGVTSRLPVIGPIVDSLMRGASSSASRDQQTLPLSATSDTYIHTYIHT